MIRGKYLSIVEARCRPFIEDDCFWCMAIEFSPAYFAQLKHELEANGHEVILRDDFFWDTWESLPVGFFSVNDRLPGESFQLLLF